MIEAGEQANRFAGLEPINDYIGFIFINPESMLTTINSQPALVDHRL